MSFTLFSFSSRLRNRFSSMWHYTNAGALLVLNLVIPVPDSWASAAADSEPANAALASKQLFSAPVHFESNAGQTDGEVKFLARGPGYSVFLTAREAVLALRTSTQKMAESHASKPAEVRMKFIGANNETVLTGRERNEGCANYFIGSNPNRWRTGIPTFAKVQYGKIYTDIDLVFYGNQKQLEYDFVVHPHADPRSIAIEFSGADNLELDIEGGLIAHLSEGEVRWKKPFAYQQTIVGQQPVSANFVLNNNTVSFQLGAYDTSRPLIIDPVLVWATYIGGSGSEYVSGIQVDSSGNSYIIGDTSSLNFPTKSGYRSSSAGSNDIFVTKFNSAGTALIYSTYLGGTGNDYSGGIAIDSAGNAYLTGHTDSQNFPTANAAYSGNQGFYDAFITKLGPLGTNLLYSTYLGGGGDDFGRVIAVDPSGNAYIAGRTYSRGNGSGPFPTSQGAYQNDNGSGNTIGEDVFVTKFAANGSLSYSTFLGGHTDERPNGIAVDAAGNAYVVGEVTYNGDPLAVPSSDFPITGGAFQTSFNKGYTNIDYAGYTDGFLTKLNPTGSGLVFSTFIGGDFDDAVGSVALDAAGRIYLAGTTYSTNLPVTATSAQPFNGGFDPLYPDEPFVGADTFISKFETNGTTLLYSTYLGGSGDEKGFLVDRVSIAVDTLGSVYLAGSTSGAGESQGFPFTNGADQTNSSAAFDAFVAKLNPGAAGSASLVYCSLLSGDTGLGGNADNEAAGIAVDSGGNFYVAGRTTATNFPVTPGAFRSTNSGGYADVFVAKLASPSDISVTMVASTNPVTVGSNLTYTIQINNNGRSSFTGVTNFVRFVTNNVRIGPITSTNGNFTILGDVVVFNLGTLSSNASVTEIIIVTNVAVGTITNSATLSTFESATLEPNTNNNTAAVVSTIRGIVDLTLSQSAAPNPALGSSNLTFTLNFVNKSGAYSANSVVLNDLLPASLTLLSATTTVGTLTTNATNVLCSIPTLPPGATGQVTIVTTPVSAGVASNFATISGLELDPLPANNSSSVSVTVIPMADLLLKILRTGANVALYWSTNATRFGFQLQSKPTVGPLAVWVTVTNPPAVIGNQHYITNAIGGASFYRLAKP